MVTFPPPPRGQLTDQAMGHWLTKLEVWAKDLHSRVVTLEDVEPAAAAEAADDGTAYESFAHVSGNAGLAAHWNVANMAAGGGINTYFTPSINTYYAVPFVAPKRGGSIIALAWDSNAAAGNGRIAVWTNTSPETLYPNALVGETGSKANTGAVTVVETTGLSFALEPGELYWLSYETDSASASIRKLDPTGCSGILGAPLAQTSTPTGIQVAHTFGTPPSTFPAGGTYTSSASGNSPALGYRVGA